MGSRAHGLKVEIEIFMGNNPATQERDHVTQAVVTEVFHKFASAIGLHFSKGREFPVEFGLRGFLPMTDEYPLTVSAVTTQRRFEAVAHVAAVTEEQSNG